MYMICIYRLFEGVSADLAGERLEQPARLELGQAEAAHERLALGRLDLRDVRDQVSLPIEHAHAVSRFARSQQLASASTRMYGGARRSLASTARRAASTSGARRV